MKWVGTTRPRMATLAAQLGELARLFGEVAARDPLSGLLVLLGALITGLSVLVLAWLGIGAALALATDAATTEAPERGAR